MNSRIKKVVGLLVSLALAASAAQAANNKYKEKEKKPKPDKEQVVSIPEPATLGLLATGAAAIGLGTFLRRRKR